MPPRFDLAYNAVLAAVRGGELTESASTSRSTGSSGSSSAPASWRDPFVDETQVGNRVGTPGNLAAARPVTDRTVTLVRNDAGACCRWHRAPARRPGHRVRRRHDRDARRGDRPPRRATTTVQVTGAAPTQAQIDGRGGARPRGTRPAASSTTNERRPASANAAQRLLVAALLATGRPVVVVAVRDPYDIAYVTDAPTYVATYSFRAVALESLARVLLRRGQPGGPAAGHHPARRPAGHHAVPVRPRPAATAAGDPGLPRANRHWAWVAPPGSPRLAHPAWLTP